MGRVFVAGSIDMDVVATATGIQVGETVAGHAVIIFRAAKAPTRRSLPRSSAHRPR